MVDSRRQAGQLLDHRPGSAKGRCHSEQRLCDPKPRLSLGKHESYAVPPPPRLHPIPELPAGQPVLALPVDRGRLAVRTVPSPDGNGRLASPPSSGLNASSRRKLPPMRPCQRRARVAPNGSRRGPSHPTAGVLAAREHARRAVLRCCRDGDGRRSGAAFCTASTTQNADYALLNDTARAVILCAREPNVLGHPSFRWE